jgi:hypothetical protein
MRSVIMSVLGARCAPAGVIPCRCMLTQAPSCAGVSLHGGPQADPAQRLISLRDFKTSSSSHDRPGKSNRQRRPRTTVHAASQPSQQQRSNSRLPQMERYFATCHPGLEQVVVNELLSPQIGAAGANVGKAGVYFW